MMRRHDLDPVSLTFGFAFTGLGLLLLFGQADQALRLRWIWPFLLGVLGVGILLDLARGARRPDTAPDPLTDPDHAVGSDAEATPAPGAPTAALGGVGDPDASGAVDDREGLVHDREGLVDDREGVVDDREHPR
jgi:hypothetical protein